MHWDGSFHTYQRFFTHLAAVLESPLLDAELGTSNLVVGSDEEKALVKAVKCSFSGTKIVSEYDQEIPQSQTADNPVAP